MALEMLPAFSAFLPSLEVMAVAAHLQRACRSGKAERARQRSVSMGTAWWPLPILRLLLDPVSCGGDGLAHLLWRRAADVVSRRHGAFQGEKIEYILCDGFAETL